MIDWNKTTNEDLDLIRDIAKRAVDLEPDLDYSTIEMDITAAHTANPLKLDELLHTDSMNFAHDVFGINQNINRDSGEMNNCFLPRYAA